ncbi:MAG: GMC family oxidoreductase [Planctomycetes bacterium]|nr:GMC family oxidoreductase [Planctomycetota bacterium]
MSTSYDVVIIGSGAGGGTLAHALAGSGKRVLVLERGGFLPRERENWDEKAVCLDRRYATAERWRDADGREFAPSVHYVVGGNTKMYGAALLRLRAHDFAEVRHHGGTSPAWPIAYEQLESYYSAAERLYSVHGRRGADPHDPPSSTPYPFRALEHEPRIAELARDLEHQGLRPFPIPLGVRLGETSHATAPIRLARFDGYPDPTEVKADAHVAALVPAQSRGGVTLRTECVVERLLTSTSGREITGVLVRHGDETEVVRGSIVVVACGAVNSAALLLRSANDAHPHGLANRSGLVGRNLMLHHNGMLLAVCDVENPSVFQKTFGLTDFYRGASAHEGHGASEFPLGTIQLMGKPDRWTVEFMAKESSLANRTADDLLAHSVDFFLTSEDLPDPRNRVTVGADGGITLSYLPNNLAAYEALRERTESIVARAELAHGRARPDFLHLRLGIQAVSHQNGTLRFGCDPATSVLDPECRAWDVHNLYAVDGSFFPSSGAVNPSLTIMANALRVGERLLDRLGR